MNATTQPPATSRPATIAFFGIPVFMLGATALASWLVITGHIQPVGVAATAATFALIAGSLELAAKVDGVPESFKYWADLIAAVVKPFLLAAGLVAVFAAVV